MPLLQAGERHKATGSTMNHVIEVPPPWNNAHSGGLICLLPPPNLVREHVEKILSIDAFRKADRLRTLLPYLVEAVLKGEHVKEYDIAVGAFKKKVDFDPLTDGSVRAAAKHLRTKLREYYASEGENDPIRVEIPSGGYAAKIRWAPSSSAEKDSALARESNTQTSPLIDRWEIPRATGPRLCGQITRSGVNEATGISTISSVAVMGNKKRRTRYNVVVGRCKVSYTDSEGISHTVQVDAESLFEAVAAAVAEFRDDKTIEIEPGSHTEFTVQVLRQPVEHRVRLKKVQDWAQPSTQGGPAEIVKRNG